MKRLSLLVLLVSLLAAAGVVPGFAQGETSTPSLGDLARQIRAERTKTPQTTKVFTNDNLPAVRPDEPVTVGRGEPGTSVESKGAKANEKQAAKPGVKPKVGTSTAADSSEGPHGEHYYQEKMNDLRAQMDMHQRELSVLQQKFGQAQTVYSPDPYKTLIQESTPAFYSDENKLREQIKAKQDQIDADQKAMDDLQEQLRREGGDPGWIR